MHCFYGSQQWLLYSTLQLASYLGSSTSIGVLTLFGSSQFSSILIGYVTEQYEEALLPIDQVWSFMKSLGITEGPSFAHVNTRRNTSQEVLCDLIDRGHGFREYRGSTNLALESGRGSLVRTCRSKLSFAMPQSADIGIIG
jgi:hypothetical protein